jgi:hypothetical protein
MQTGHRTRILYGSVVAAAILTGARALPISAQVKATRHASAVTYVAHLSALNSKAAGGSATGTATFTVKGDSLTIAVVARGLPKDMIHWQHFHGFTDGRAAACPTRAADVNHDGIIDVVETGPAAGTTMVPFSDDPVSLDVAQGVYPSASATGTLHYTRTVSLSALQAAFSKAFPGQTLDLDRRVVFLHGVPATSHLPASVASLGPIPAAVTLPIACGRISRAR